MTEKAGKRAAIPPTGTVTFLFTDIEGSTSMWEKAPVRMEDALARHDDILKSSIEAHEGYVFKTVGDAFYATFITARQALEATLAAQRALLAEEWPENTTIRVRMGLHTGVADERNGDYFGSPVNRVARLHSAGYGGQILLSQVTYGLVRDFLSSLEPGAELRDMGEHHLKDLRYSECIYQLIVPDLPADFPALKTLDTRSNERYGLVKLVGSGGMAEVYLARDQELDRDVALKVLKHQYADDEQFVERFRDEAKNVASLSHPNIVQVYDRGKTKDGAYYIVMEYVSEGTLKDRILEEGPLPAPAATALTLQVARALRVAHEHGVTHCDIKPQNILLTRSGEAKVADFGIAWAAASSTMTRTGFVMGTTHYISPEQALGQSAGPRSDLYSLGVVLYEMLTGAVPYDAETPIGIAMKHVSGQLRPPKEANPDVPEEINAVAVRLLAQDPENRYQTAVELVEDLERVGQGQSPAFVAAPQQDGIPIKPTRPPAEPGGQSPALSPDGAPPGSPPAHPGEGGDTGGGQPRRRRVSPWALAAGLLVALLGIGIFLAVRLSSGGEEKSSEVASVAGEGPLLEEASTPGYAIARDNTGRLSVEVPFKWSAVDGTAWDFRGGKIGQSVVATTDLETWYHHNYYHTSAEGIDETPGVLFEVSRRLVNQYPEDTEDQVLSLPEYDYTGTCEYDARDDYDDGIYTGKSDHWTNCGETDAEVYVHALLPDDRAHVVLIQILAGSEADLEAEKHVLDTFKVEQASSRP